MHACLRFIRSTFRIRFSISYTLYFFILFLRFGDLKHFMNDFYLRCDRQILQTNGLSASTLTRVISCAIIMRKWVIASYCIESYLVFLFSFFYLKVLECIVQTHTHRNKHIYHIFILLFIFFNNSDELQITGIFCCIT